VNEKGNFSVEFAERGERRERDLNEIADPADIDEHLIRAFFGEASAKLANHRRSVLPPFVRLSTQEGMGESETALCASLTVERLEQKNAAAGDNQRLKSLALTQGSQSFGTCSHHDSLGAVDNVMADGLELPCVFKMR
jgi:hypothetical protein